MSVLSRAALFALGGAVLAIPASAQTVARKDLSVDGAVIIATGFQHFDPGRETQQYGYYEHDDVITLVDLERMLKAETVVRPSNGQPPKRLCFIQCVGSRDQIGRAHV